MSDGSFGSALKLFFLLAAGHAIADFPMQSEFMANWKNRHFQVAKGSGLPSPGRVWPFLMIPHCLIHAVSVYIITGRALFGVVEFAAHFVIDTLKCDRKISFVTDQIAHYACKAGFTVWFVCS